MNVWDVVYTVLTVTPWVIAVVLPIAIVGEAMSDVSRSSRDH